MIRGAEAIVAAGWGHNTSLVFRIRAHEWDKGVDAA